MTELDREIVQDLRSRFGSRWFAWFEVPAMIHRRGWRLSRLRRMGFVERDFDIDGTSIYRNTYKDLPTPS